MKELKEEKSHFSVATKRKHLLADTVLITMKGHICEGSVYYTASVIWHLHTPLRDQLKGYEGIHTGETSTFIV